MALLGSITSAEDNTMNTLRGIGFFNEQGRTGNFCVSMAGGSILSIIGSHMNQDPASNLVNFRTSTLTGSEITLQGISLND
jgi:hypothetical protein